MTNAVLSFSELNEKNGDYATAAPSGRMSKYIGRAYNADDWRKLSYSKCLTDRQSRKRAYLLRAFEVLPLKKQVFTSHGLKEVRHSLERLIKDKMPGIRWRVDEKWYLPLLKYQILHGSIPAPIDRLTGDNMSIELYAKLIDYSGKAREDVIQEYRLFMQRFVDKQVTEPQLEECLSGMMRFRVESATYANIMYSGIGVPFYM